MLGRARRRVGGSARIEAGACIRVARREYADSKVSTAPRERLRTETPASSQTAPGSPEGCPRARPFALSRFGECGDERRQHWIVDFVGQEAGQRCVSCVSEGGAMEQGANVQLPHAGT